MKKLSIPLLAALLSGCVIYAPAHPTHRDEYPIPKGHMPPPGECRIWYPDRPPGQQAPPGNCRELRYHVPPGAYLIKG